MFFHFLSNFFPYAEAEEDASSGEEAAGKGDPFAIAGRRSARSKRGINAPPSEEEKKLPPTKRHTKAGGMSERVSGEEEGRRKRVTFFCYLFIINSNLLHLLAFLAVCI